VTLIAAPHGGQYAYSLGRYHRLRRRHYCSVSGTRSKQPRGFHPHYLLGIVGAFVATFIGQAIGWYGPNQDAGLIGAVIGALVVLFVWHRLVMRHAIPDPGDRRYL
jgi:uncharacterized membrane protein YeaQ/YmgE (transglycosylase-associated protein family)